MSLLDRLSEPTVWEKFYQYKTSLACPKDIEKRLRGFLDAQEYLPVCELISKIAKNPQDPAFSGVQGVSQSRAFPEIQGVSQSRAFPESQGVSQSRAFPLPRKSVISKQSTQKKRVVYTYPFAENTVLKLLTYLLLRTYNDLFSDNLFSFRPGRSAQEAIRRLQKIPNLYQKYTYKVDVSNYFNSIPVERLLPDLETITREDPELFTFLKALLTEPYVIDDGAPSHRDAAPQITGQSVLIKEQKGIMAGTPLASFYANLYLRDVDQWFHDQNIPYARYSDDVIVFGDTMEEVQKHANAIRSFLGAKGLSVNPAKEEFRRPEEGFVFLGFLLKKGVIDVAPASVTKIKQKMRRKARALQRWKNRNHLPGDKAAKAFIRIFNRKLLESPQDTDLSWSYWYFSSINTTESLHVIDLYAQECLRFLLTGTHTKSRFNARYEDLKRLGYETLVNAYYKQSAMNAVPAKRRTATLTKENKNGSHEE